MVRKAADATAARKAKMKGKGTAGRKGKAAELLLEADEQPSNEKNPFLQSHQTSLDCEVIRKHAPNCLEMKRLNREISSVHQGGCPLGK